MERKALEHATERLIRAKLALQDLEAQTEIRGMEEAFSRFLAAANQIFSKLEQGAKSNGASEAWFGRIKSERKEDGLLSYIHHARNADEHCLGDVTDYRPGMEGVVVENELLYSRMINKDNPRNFKVMGWGEKTGTRELPFTRLRNPEISLVTLTDRGVKYAPPKEHRGEAIEDNSPAAVAKLAISYLEDLVNVAASFADEAG